MGAEVEELTRDRGASILVHGLPVQQAECLESLVKLMSDLIRTRLGIGREMVLVSINRLKPTKWVEAKVEQQIFVERCEVGGWPPLVLCFEHSYDRDAVLGKAHLLDRQLFCCHFYCHGFRTGILITEDMARCVREQWGELRKFMLKVSWLPDNLNKVETEMKYD